MFFAGRLAQASRRGSLRISGNSVVGHDIRWETPDGYLALIERKDRSYEPGLKDTDAARIRRVVDATDTAGRKTPLEVGAARILMVGFQHLVRPEEKDALGDQYVAALEAKFRLDQSKDLPDCVIAEHFGIEPKTGGEKTNFWCPVPLRKSEELGRVWPLLWKAVGGDTPE